MRVICGITWGTMLATIWNNLQTDFGMRVLKKMDDLYDV